MTTQEHAAKLRQLADDLDPPPKPIRLPLGDMTLDEAVLALRALQAGNNQGLPHVSMKVWMHTNPPYVAWQAGAVGTYSADQGTLRAAVERLRKLIHDKTHPEPEGTVENAAKVLAEATEPVSAETLELVS